MDDFRKWMIFIYHNVPHYDLSIHQKKLKFMNTFYNRYEFSLQSLQKFIIISKFQQNA
jgi:hypothetical protein